LQLHWHSICLDEAQNIKNAYTKQSQAIRGLTAGHRIAMTGTPMENRLTELWSIFDFINPGYLGSLRSFTEWFVNPIEKAQDNERITQVQRLVRPFLLRRMKTDPLIELDLPEKTEAKVYVSLTAEQAALYESVLQDMLTKLDTLLPMERRGAILATLTKLKQVCNHPALALKDESARRFVAERSAKVERLLEMVQELRAEGDQCLIFTQFVEAGNLLQSLLAEALGEPILFLHGGVPKAKRDAMITEFQSTTSSPGVFLLSLKAGGVGLNLTAASHVFHFDRWWNPAVENQATDRAFRIGQTRHVQVHKFVALGTLEERIDEMIERKQTLSEHIVGAGEQWITEMSTDDLRDLFALRREWVTES
jgi:SNF2 family DNA or RNA helicase